ITLAFKSPFPPNIYTLSSKELCPFQEQHHWPDIKQFSHWSETDLLHGNYILQKKKACSLLQESNLRPCFTCLVFLPGQVEFCSGSFEIAKRGMASCKKKKKKKKTGNEKIVQSSAHPFSGSRGDMREWYHIKCTFEKLKWAQATTKDIEDHIELESWEELEDNEKAQIIQHIADLSSKAIGTLKKKAIVQAKLIATGQVTSPVKDVSFVTNTNPQKFSGFSVKPKNFGEACSSQTLKAIFSSKCVPKHKYCPLCELSKLCAMVAENPGYNTKTQIIQDFLWKSKSGGRA
uniref:PARP-type domain-containing protein n=1 Tax=Mustela putorius furo TaxID=9669 RepID=M3XMG0_MUSPF